MSAQISTTVLMSVEEATDCLAFIRDTVTDINRAITQGRSQLLTFDEGEGWRVLGYDSLRACLSTELGVGQSQAYRLLTAAKVERRISEVSPGGKNASTKVLNVVAQLPEDIQAKVFVAAEKAGPVTPQAIVTAASFTRIEGIYSKERQAKGKTVAPVKQARYHKNCPTCSC